MATHTVDTTDLTVMVRLTETAAASRSLLTFRRLGEGAGERRTGLTDLDAAITASGSTLIWRLCDPSSRRGRGTAASAQLMYALRAILSRTLVLIAADATTCGKLLTNLHSVRSVEHMERAVGRVAVGRVAEGQTMPTTEPRIPFDDLVSAQWGLTAIGWTRLARSAVEVAATAEIGIIDTSIISSTPDLPASKLISVKKCMAPDSTDSSHGTGVASVAASAMRSGKPETHYTPSGMVGVHPGAKLRSAVVLPSGGDRASSADLACALIHLADGRVTPLSGPPLAEVINVSIAGEDSSDVERCAVYYALARGALVVAASGNNANATPEYPARYEAEPTVGLEQWAAVAQDLKIASSKFELTKLSAGLLVVGAIAKSDSGYVRWTDPGSVGSSAVGDRGLVAPGKDIVIRDASGRIGEGSGTSFAAPHVSGAASLLIAYRSAHELPRLSNTQLANALRQSASQSDLIGDDVSEWCGHGLLNVKRLIEAAE